MSDIHENSRSANVVMITNKKIDECASRLTPFEKLPRIGSSHEYVPHPPQSHQTTTNPRSKLFIKQEPVLIAIKLSDGRRLQR